MEILLVDDDIMARGAIAEFLREFGHTVIECDNGLAAYQTFLAGDFPMVLSDIKMPHMSGLELLKAINAGNRQEFTDVVLFTGFGDMDSALTALRVGAYDYLLKPVNVEELAAITERIAEHQALRRENRKLTRHFEEAVQSATAESRHQVQLLKQIAAQSVGLSDVAFFSEAMRTVANQAEKYHHDRSIPVLIQGETGTGKEVIARLIHYDGMERSQPFIDINCAAITPSLFESELFGYEPGTFTGGLSRGQKGKIDLAQGGTLFLDEIAEIPLELQSRLLRVIEEKEYYRVGGLKKLKTDVRLICATNADLLQRVEAGTFRKDLYFRLKVGHLHLPPLRDRRDDILPLAGLFLERFSRQKGKRFTKIGSDTAEMLLAYHWPGNVRELRNAIEWAAFMYDDTLLRPEHLSIIAAAGEVPLRAGGQSEPVIEPFRFRLPDAGLNLDDYMRRIIEAALIRHHGNKAATARYLGISRHSLYCRLRDQEDA